MAACVKSCVCVGGGVRVCVRGFLSVGSCVWLRMCVLVLARVCVCGRVCECMLGYVRVWVRVCVLVSKQMWVRVCCAYECVGV